MRRFLPRLSLLAVPLALTFILSACSQPSTSAPFIPPAANSAPTVTLTVTSASSPVALPTFTLQPPTASPAPTDTPVPTSETCTNNLTLFKT